MDFGLDMYLKLIKDKCQCAKKEEFIQIQSEAARKKTVRIEDVFVKPTLVLESINNSYSRKEIEIDDTRASIKYNENYEGLAPKSKRVRMCISSERGAGKTVLCKRLMLALINNDREFVEKCFSKKVAFENDSIPLYLNFNNLIEEASCDSYGVDSRFSTVSTHSDLIFRPNNVNGNAYRATCYKYLFKALVSLFGDDIDLSFSNNHILFDPIYNMIASYPSNKIVLIIDGLEGFIGVDTEWFIEWMRTLMKAMPDIKLVFTLDDSNTRWIQALFSYISLENLSWLEEWAWYRIDTLSMSEIDEYCNIWCRINHEYLAADYQKELTQQIHAIYNWAPMLIGNPYFLITVIGRLDSHSALLSNKADYIEFFIKTNIRMALHSNYELMDSLLYILSYVASEIGLPFFRIIELTEAVDNARIFLNEKQMLVEAINELPTSSIVSLLLKTNLIKPLSDRIIETERRQYIFVQEIKDFLVAYAVVFTPFFHLSPVDYYEDKFEKTEWRKAIVYSVLFFNRPKVFQRITERLLSKSKEDSSRFYYDLLFEMIANGMKIDPHYRCEIYNYLFKDDITQTSLKNINFLHSLKNETWFEFKDYISEKYAECVSNHEEGFVYANEAIVSLNDLNHTRTLRLFQKGDKDSVINGIAHLQVNAINEILGVYHKIYGITARGNWLPQSIISILRELLRDKLYNPLVSKCIKYAVIAWFVPLGRLLNTDDIIAYCQQLSEPDKRYNSELLLSIEPIVGIEEITGGSIVSDLIKKEYINRFEKSVEKQTSEEMVSLYNLCVTIGCWNGKEIDDMYMKISQFFELPCKRSVGSAHFMHIRNHRHKKTIKQIAEYSPFSRIHAWEDLSRYSFP